MVTFMQMAYELIQSYSNKYITLITLFIETSTVETERTIDVTYK